MKTSFYPLLIVVVLLLCNPTRSNAQKNVSKSPAIQIFYSGGSGTVGDPYQISNLTDLRYLSEHSADWSKYFKQTADIDATATNTWNVGNHDNNAGTPDVAMGFLPIGNSSTNFTGKYDGQNHTITSLYINRPFLDNIGLFGYINSDSDIRNLGLINLSYVGFQYVGGLVGSGYSGSISNTYTKGTIVVDSKGNSSAAFGGLVGMTFAAFTISDSYSEANVSGTRNCAGGLVGINWGTITKCYATGSVSGEGSSRGGLVGENAVVTNAGIIRESYATGNVYGSTTAGQYFGGLVGRNNNGYIYDSYSKGSVTGYDMVGGLIGQFLSPNYSVISNSYSIGSVSSTTTNKGGLIGDRYSGSINNCFWNTETSGIATSRGGTGKTTAEMKTQATFSGWDYVTTPVWKIDSNNSGYPYLAWQTYPSPEIDVKQGTTAIADGTGTYDFGSKNTTTNTDIVFTIENNGTAASSLGSFSISGTNADQFSLQGTNPTTVSNAGTTTFTVRFSPTSAGSKTAIVSFANQDANENPYSFTITGTAVAPVVIFSGGAGTLASPYQIATLADLRFLSENTSYWAAGKYFIQTADIDATATNTWNSNGSGGYYGFSPIGTVSIAFQGNYNGQGFTINKLFINRVATDYIGLFGNANSATLTNIGLTNVNITGRNYVGALIGQSTSLTISNCYSTGTMNGGIDANNNGVIGGLIGNSISGSVQYCYSSCNVTGKKRVGGFIGLFNNFNINCCYATGAVLLNGTLNNTYAGGFGGDCEESIAGFVMKNCYATGSVTNSSTGGLAYAGGFAGFIGGTVVINNENCYCTGAVSAVNTPKGFVARILGSPVNTNCFFDNQTSNQTSAGNTGITGLTTAEMKTQSTFTGWDFVTTPVWKIDSNNNGYPYLAWQTYSIIAPTLQASALVFTSVTNYGMTIGWTNGNGSARAVFVKEGTGVISNPVNQTTYTANSDWATKATQLAASGYYCVYKGTGNSVNVTNLSKNTEYSVQVFELNGASGSEVYNTSTGIDNPKNQTTANESGTAYDLKNVIRVKVYPNPATEVFHIEGLSGISSIYITDLSGRLLLEKQVSDNEGIQINALPQGVYIVKIETNNEKKELKLIKGI